MKYAFADCVLDTQAHTLTRAGETQHVEPKVFDLLLLLVQHAGALVTRDEMIEAIWGGRIVSESAISARIAAARRAVGDDGKSQNVIRTVARRGLQFVAELQPEELPEKASTKRTAHAPRVRYATADDGVKIAFAVSGEGPPLLRVAHYPTHLELEWGEPFQQKLFEALAQRHSLIRMDQRGCGLSDLDVEDFSTARTAKDMVAVLDTLGIDKTAVFGSSSGGMIAAEFAATFPERISHLITLGGYVDGRSVRGEKGTPPVEDSILQMAREGWNAEDGAFVVGYLAVYFPTAPMEELRVIARNLQKSCSVENETRGRGFFNGHSIAAMLERIKAPTLVIHSRGDAVHPLSEGQKMARGIADAQLMILESPNHYPRSEEDCWKDMVNAISEFLEI